jgi:hypothetical protein
MACKKGGFGDWCHLCQANTGLQMPRGRQVCGARRAGGAKAHGVQARSMALWLAFS